MSQRIALVAGALAFVAIALVVGRWLQADSVERSKVERLLAAQARGDAGAMRAEMDACDPACRVRAERLSRRMRRPGEVEIVRYDSETAHALGEQDGTARVVWRAGQGLPIVQCVRVRRTGSMLRGPVVRLTGLSAPIGLEASC